MLIPFAKNDEIVSKTCHLTNNERAFFSFVPAFLALLRNDAYTEKIVEVVEFNCFLTCNCAHFMEIDPIGTVTGVNLIVKRPIFTTIAFTLCLGFLFHWKVFTIIHFKNFCCSENDSIFVWPFFRKFIWKDRESVTVLFAKQPKLLSHLRWIDLISWTTFIVFIYLGFLCASSQYTEKSMRRANCVKMNLIVKLLNIVNEYSGVFRLLFAFLTLLVALLYHYNAKLRWFFQFKHQEKSVSIHCLFFLTTCLGILFSGCLTFYVNV